MKKRGFLLFVIVSAVLISFSALAQNDEDNDGYCTTLSNTACPNHQDELDCNDNNPMINPGHSEGSSPDGFDNNCNGLIDDIQILCADSDLDKYNKTLEGETIEICGPNDCNDASAFINPGVQEACNDGIDNDCDGKADADDPDCEEDTDEGGENTDGGDDVCRILEAESGWYNCDTPAEMVSRANNTDTVFLVLFTENCKGNSVIKFNISEYNARRQPVFVGAFEASGKILNLPDENGNPSAISVWYGVWAASYMADSDGSDPEYYFEALLTEPGNKKYKFNGQQADKMLSVKRCPANNPNCGIVCAFAGSEPMANYTNGTARNITCPTIIDCSEAGWSECDPSTNVRTRDVSKCIIPSSDPACIAMRLSEVVAEQACLPAIRPDTPPAHAKTGPAAECGNGKCEADEDADSCPEDCAEAPSTKNWAWLIFIIIVLVMISGAIAGYFIVKKKKVAPAEASAAKPAESMPFTSQKDLDSVINYINTARQKGLGLEQIAKLLAQGGWKGEQIKYAFTKLSPTPQQQKIPFANRQDLDAIVNYINTAKQRGLSEQQIRVSLLTSGRSEDQVKFAFSEAEKKEAQPAQK